MPPGRIDVATIFLLLTREIIKDLPLFKIPSYQTLCVLLIVGYLTSLLE